MPQHRPHSLHRSVIALLCAAPLTSCATFISSHKAENGVGPGAVVYHLPVPVLEASPAADGTATFTVTNYPDLNNAYTLDASSLLSAYKLEVTLDKGMLSKVSMDAKNTDVATAGIGAIQALVQEQVKATIAEQKAKEAEKTGQGNAPADDAGAGPTAKRIDATAFGPAFYTIRQRIDPDGLPTVELIEADFGAVGRLQVKFPVAGLAGAAPGPTISAKVQNNVAIAQGSDWVWQAETSSVVPELKASLAATSAPAIALRELVGKPEATPPTTRFSLATPRTGLVSGSYKLRPRYRDESGVEKSISPIDVKIP